MSISLPNGTIIANPSSSSSTVSAAVTRILHLSNFSAELKTRDIQNIFRDYENEKGGFRIKWVDDVNALVVFNDASIAKKAYLSLLLHPPASFLPPAAIRPYDKPDASQIIASLAARSMGHRASMSHSMSQSLPASSAESHHVRAPSFSGGLNSFQMPLNGSGAKSHRGSNSLSTSSTSRHQRTGSASSSWARSGFGSSSGGGGGGGGVLNFSVPTSTAPRLATHSESSQPSRSSSASDGEPIVIMNSAFPRTGTKIPPVVTGGRRESVSADKALREIQKALASVEAAG